jgi:hypothetical protein
VGGYLIPDIFDFQRILALPSSRADPAPANSRPAGPESQRFSDMPTPTPGETLDREMVIRCMQAGAIPGVHYTALDMDQLVNYIVRLLTGRLNALLDQDAQGNLQPNGQVPGVVSKVNIRRRNTPEDLKKFIKWTRRDYLKEMTFPDIPAYKNRLRHFSLDGPFGIVDIMELVVEVERRVQGLPVPNQGLWNNAPVVPAVPPPAVAPPIIALPANAQPMLPTQPHIMPGTQNDSASLLSQSAQLTSTPNGQQMLPPTKRAVRHGSISSAIEDYSASRSANAIRSRAAGITTTGNSTGYQQYSAGSASQCLRPAIF